MRLQSHRGAVASWLLGVARQHSWVPQDAAAVALLKARLCSRPVPAIAVHLISRDWLRAGGNGLATCAYSSLRVQASKDEQCRGAGPPDESEPVLRTVIAVVPHAHAQSPRHMLQHHPQQQQQQQHAANPEEQHCPHAAHPELEHSPHASQPQQPLQANVAPILLCTVPPLSPPNSPPPQPPSNLTPLHQHQQQLQGQQQEQQQQHEQLLAQPLPEHLKRLNAEQLAAVCDLCHSAISVTAGPGSGKTRVIVARIYELVERYGVLPEHVAVITFTLKAADELKTRLQPLLAAQQDVQRQQGGGVKERQMFTGTFHSFCQRILE
jgi:hypothetical protein